jgi:N-acetylmuramoyl-L-alanine amidase
VWKIFLGDFEMKIDVIDSRPIKRVLAMIVVLMLSAVVTAVVLLQVDKSIVALEAGKEDTQVKITSVIIDPGHGGEDPGAIGANGVYEKDLNLSIAYMLKESLAEKGYDVILTRDSDRMLYSESENIKGMRKLSDLKNRCAVGNQHPEAIFVSIHMNTFGASEYSGLQVYYPKGSEEGKALAASVQSTVREQLQSENHRSIKGGEGMYLLDNIKSTAILVECGFLSNPDECKKLTEKEYQKQLSLSIACGIISYIEQRNADGVN